MTENKLIKELNSIIGLRITEIKYVLTKFFYPDLNGDWTEVHPDTFVLHGQEWQFTLSDGRTWFLTNPQKDLKKGPLKSNITISSESIAKPADNTLSVPNDYQWKDVLDNEIKGFRLWRRVTKTLNICGLEMNKQYQDNIQIVQLLYKNKSFFISTMNGDIGDTTFYPTGYLGDKLGVFFDKQVADSYIIQGLTMTMEASYDSMKIKSTTRQ
ncbi:MAG: hypothetical protein CL843_00910 [Crocinitomicaceae bacterium]|nr:hypothetical protein [Crocinitomicaceae bacterium]|tara:strand:+ start:230 stop:865 length:636 start_codon:yes stop_codon:yes gene_type:complete